MVFRCFKEEHMLKYLCKYNIGPTFSNYDNCNTAETLCDCCICSQYCSSLQYKSKTI